MRSLVPVLIAFSQLSDAAPFRVLVDPGHGGKDRGAVVGPMRESDITLKVGKKLVDLLNQDSRFKAELTRGDDRFLSLSERVRRAEKMRASLYMSVHVNWSTDRAAHGVEIYFQNQLPPDEESMFLAARENSEDAEFTPELPDLVKKIENPEVNLIVQDLLRNQRIYASSQIAKSIKSTWAGGVKARSLSVRQAPFFVISNQVVPSVLVEIGFLSHPQEGTRLASDAYLDVIAQSLHDGVASYYEGMDKVRAPRLE